MAIVLRYVDGDGVVRERFLEVVAVDDTNSVTLKTQICNILSYHKLLVENMRGQGYDGASNMWGEWNGLQALFLKNCPYAYYVHCFVHRLQLALAAAAKEVSDIWLFFSKLTSIVNFVTVSSKRHCQLQSIREDEIVELILLGDLGTGSGYNQACALQRPGSTRWSSHYTSVSRVIELFGSICILLEDLIEKGSNFSIRAEAKGLYLGMMAFEFVFMLLLVHRISEVSDVLCQALQRKDQDILNAMKLVTSTKLLFQKMRNDEWNDFLWSVNDFCGVHDIEVPDFSDPYIQGTKHSCQQKNHFTLEKHYHFHVFNVVVVKQLMELNNRFTEQSMELLTLYDALNPSDRFQSFSESVICSLAEKFYPCDFPRDDMKFLRSQLDHYKIDVFEDPRFKNIDSLPKLCRLLTETKNILAMQ